MTGEATPVEKRVGDILLAGTMNLWGAVEAEVLKRAQESSLQKIIKLIKTACPHAKIIVTAESSQRALQMYKEGAD